MDLLIHRFDNKIKTCNKRFDRIVFTGTLRPIAFELGIKCNIHYNLRELFETPICQLSISTLAKVNTEL